MDNPEKLGAYGTQYARQRQPKQKHNTVCGGYYYAQASTNNVNKT